ncbi:CHAT domain-containing protein [Nocardia sp. NPDC052566]|uniref:CHAT domain-containing protein n=1 Tax=Nocardia sp. NPDC052566 TaxID=3364330 RepID=UPI0037CC7356
MIANIFSSIAGPSIDTTLTQRVSELGARAQVAEESLSVTKVREACAELNQFILEFVPTMGGDLRKSIVATDVLRWAILLESKLPDCNWFRVAMVSALHSGAYANSTAQLWKKNEIVTHLRAANQGVFEIGAYANHRAKMPALAIMLLENVSGGLYSATQAMTAMRVGGTNAWQILGRAFKYQRRVSKFRGEEWWNHQDRDTALINQRIEEFRARQVSKVLNGPVEYLPTEADLHNCVTEAAAVRSGCDVVHLAATPMGGVAFRTYCDAERIGRTTGIDLPNLATAAVCDWRTRIESLYERHDRGEIRSAAMHTELHQVLAEIGAAVLEPIRGTWPELTRLALAPVGVVATLPLGAMTLGREPAQLTFDLTVVPNAPTLLSATLHPRNESGPALVATDPGAGETHLPQVVREGRAIAAIHAVEVLNLQATPRRPPADRRSAWRVRLEERWFGVNPVRPAETGIYPAAPHPDGSVLDALQNAAIAHLACHGSLIEDPVQNSLLMLGDPPISLSEFLICPVAPGGTIVLSGCSVGGVVASLPNELLGFPAAFLSAGARTVIASTTPVLDTRATRVLLQDVHHALHAGQNGRSALRSAITAACTRGDHCYNWAGFAAYGA